MDFIDKLRDEDRRKAEEDLEYRKSKGAALARSRDVAQQYYIESGCQPYIEKLASYLNSKPGINEAQINEENGYNFDAYGQTLCWDLKNNTWEYYIKVYATADGTMIFYGGNQASRKRIPLNEWRSNKQVLVDALEYAYRNPFH